MTHDNKHTDRWQWISDTLADALQIDDRKAREAFVRTRCAEDESAAREILSLLEADGSVSEALDPQRVSASARALLSGGSTEASEVVRASHWHGKRLGSYEIIDTIAIGGMGAVYKARRADHVYETLVAIKLMREDLGAQAARTVLARFQAERQMLASLNHPNITRLIDGGSTNDGLPYFIMEYVDGEPIDRFCESNNLSVAARVSKFRDVLNAVHYAHQRLIVHRDLKPSNILVDRNGVVKLLDFGIARLLDPDVIANAPDYTRAATTVLAMTPAYASPEQVKSEAITTASDVYSLGVVLYRLLTGVSPYKSKTTQPVELAREIAETDPERPSTALSTARHPSQGDDRSRSVDVARLKKALKGDLDNIVLMALRKDPARRYASAEQFSEDLRRFLAQEPVFAHADSLAYRANKFVRRNRIAVFLTTIAAIGLIGTTSYALYQTSRAQAHGAALRALSGKAFSEVDAALASVPGAASGRKLLLENAMKYLLQLERSESGDPEFQYDLGVAYFAVGRLQGGIGHQQIGEYEKAIANLRKSATALQRALDSRPGEERYLIAYAKSLIELGRLLHQTGAPDDIESTYRKALSRIETFASSPKSIRIEQARASIYLNLGRYAREVRGSFGQSETYLRDAIATYENALAQIPTLTDDQRFDTMFSLATTRASLAGTLARLGGDKAKESLGLDLSALSTYEALAKARPDDFGASKALAIAHANVGAAYAESKNAEAAIQHLARSVQLLSVLATKDKSNTQAQVDHLEAQSVFATALVELGDCARAVTELSSARALLQALPDSAKPLRSSRLRSLEIDFYLGVCHERLADQAAEPSARRDHVRQASASFEKAASSAEKNQDLLPLVPDAAPAKLAPRIQALKTRAA